MVPEKRNHVCGVYDSCLKYAVALTLRRSVASSLLPLPLDVRGTDGHNHSVVRLKKKAAAFEAR